MELVPLNIYRNTTNTLSLLLVNNRKLLLKQYNGEKALERSGLEFQKLHFFYDRGYPVPKCYDMEIEGINGPYLVMDYLKGVSLGEFLRTPEVSKEAKIEKIGEIFQANADRHRKALELGDSRLVHYDANTGNIILSGGSCYLIDFEAPEKDKSLADSVCIEIAQLCRWIARDMGRACIDDVVEIMAKKYEKEKGLMWRIVEQTRGRFFQFIHRFRDTKKKVKNPEEVTKYDIADALCRVLERRLQRLCHHKKPGACR